MKKILPLMIVALMAAACQSGNGSGSGPNPSGVKTTVAGLTTFTSCEALSDFLNSKTGAQSAPSGSPTDATNAPSPEGTADSAGGTSGGTGTGGEVGVPAAAPSATTVEEADIVKQEGTRLYVMTSYGKLFIYDVSSASDPHRVSEVTPAIYAQSMFASGFKVALIGQPVVTDTGSGSTGGTTGGVVSDMPIYYEPSTRVVVYDTTNPAAPTVAASFDFKGSYIDSRKVGDAVYLALQRWIDEYASVPVETQLADRDPCDQVYVPKDIDGNYGSFPAWEIAGINLDDLSAAPNEVSVIGSWGSTVTSTPEHFYLTNYFYETNDTGVFLFDLDPPTAGITPRAKASVPGSIVNQFSMDESGGVFRIASTSRPTWIWGVEEPVMAALDSGTSGGTTGGGTIEPAPVPPAPEPPPTTNYLTTFRASDGSLAKLGQIDTIVPGESITAARFLGSRAFVTTYVYTDPLVSIDLSDPANPKIAGELHVPGMTNYLQAWGDDRLIAVGTGDGWSGVILNLFDISDLANPSLIEQETIPDSWGSEAQFNHLAFSLFEDRGVVALPVYTSTGSEMDVYAADRNTGFTRLGAIKHDDLISGSTGYSPQMRRSLEIGGLLYTVSEAGLKVDAFSNLTTDLFAEMFPGYTPPIYYGCGCTGDVCMECPQPL
jgi:uncharacterized secreted protein with C-terminal beta-propeller domain